MMTIFLPIRVVGFETDFAGVVSNTRYLEYMERGRYALLEATQMKVTEMVAQFGVQPIVRRVEIEYLGSARHEESLMLKVQVAEIGRTACFLEYELTRQNDGAVLMRARQTLVFINGNWKASRVPEWFREKFTQETSQVLAEHDHETT